MKSKRENGLKRFVVPLEKPINLYHFRSAAARAKAIAACAEVANMRNSNEVTAAVQAKLIDLRLVNEVKVQKTTVVYAPKQAGIRKTKSRPFYGFSGFPQKRSNPKRAKDKAEARLHAKAAIVLDRLIEQWPARAHKAKTDERMQNWFGAMVMEKLDGITDHEWLSSFTGERIKAGARNEKYRHSSRAHRTEQLKEAAE